MAAHFWRSLLACELICAMALTVVIQSTFAIAPLTIALVMLAALIAAPCALVGSSFAVSHRTTRGDLNIPELLWILATESAALEWATLAMSIEPARDDRGRNTVQAPQALKPVLLIHGVVCNRAVWNPLARELRAHGFGPIRAVNLEPIWGDIDTHAARVAIELRQLRQECGGQRVAIVCHSMGGLVARAALRAGAADDISQIITLGSPHHGTSLARLLPPPVSRQMGPNSAWLAALNRTQEGHFPVPVTSIYSANDNLIAPPRSAALEGATLHELRGLGHLSLLTHRRSIDCTLAALARH